MTETDEGVYVYNASLVTRLHSCDMTVVRRDHKSVDYAELILTSKFLQIPAWVVFRWPQDKIP